MRVWPFCTRDPLICIRHLGVSHARDWGRGDVTCPGTVRRVVVHDDLGMAIFASIPHDLTMIETCSSTEKRAETRS